MHLIVFIKMLMLNGEICSSCVCLFCEAVWCTTELQRVSLATQTQTEAQGYVCSSCDKEERCINFLNCDYLKWK